MWLKEIAMKALQQISVMLDHDVHDCLHGLQTPGDDINAVLRTLLYRAGYLSAAVGVIRRGQRHYSYAEELERARQGIYESGGAT